MCSWQFQVTIFAIKTLFMTYIDIAYIQPCVVNQMGAYLERKLVSHASQLLAGWPGWCVDKGVYTGRGTSARCLEQDFLTAPCELEQAPCGLVFWSERDGSFSFCFRFLRCRRHTLRHSFGNLTPLYASTIFTLAVF